MAIRTVQISMPGTKQHTRCSRLPVTLLGTGTQNAPQCQTCRNVFWGDGTTCVRGNNEASVSFISEAALLKLSDA